MGEMWPGVEPPTLIEAAVAFTRAITDEEYDELEPIAQFWFTVLQQAVEQLPREMRRG